MCDESEKSAAACVENIAAAEISSPNNNSGHQADYRLNLNDAASVLEAVPEEIGGQLHKQQQPSGLQSTPINSNMTANFHIPESNASDVAASECSSYYNQDLTAQQLTKTEALSARQQVVLWLTRTSMSDLSSMPSLKNLVQGANARPTRSGQRFTPVSSSSEKSYRQQNPTIQRNFSTKSFLKSSKFEEDDPEVPIRKCETVIALSGMSTTSSTTSSAKRNQHTNSQTKKKSPLRALSVFRDLSRSRTSSKDGNNVFGSNPRGPTTSTCESPFPGMKPTNRLRSTNSSMVCSRCTSVMSVNNSRMTSRCTSQMSLFQMAAMNRRLSSVTSPTQQQKSDDQDNEPPILCKICLVDYSSRDMIKLQQCSCSFCKECMGQYLSFEIMAGAYEISCPDPGCEKEGVLQFTEMEPLVGKELMEKHKTFRLNTEVALDSNRAWCPKPGCNTICHICASSGDSTVPTSSQQTKLDPAAVICPKCEKEFCSACSSNWHPEATCHENGKRLVMQGMTEGHPSTSDALLMIDGSENIKRCPMCHVPIERDAGCAQMMCKRCKHVFCWFCLTSLDDDFLLRHYDSGVCKGKLGHSRTSVLWHRAQVIGIFAGFVVLLLMASPLLLVAAPCIFCCRCKSCTELEDELIEVNILDTNNGNKISRTNSGLTMQVLQKE